MRILHCLRAPLGGLFRHVTDLTVQQSREGHEVAVICDRNGGNAMSEQLFAELEEHAGLGIHRVAMGRLPGLSDVGAACSTIRIASDAGVDIIHGHGAKGGAHARLAARALGRKGRGVAAIYTPHGGSLHYHRARLSGRLFLGLERMLLHWSDGIIFESDYSRRAFERKIATPDCPVAVIPNGLKGSEFEPVEPSPGARDFVFVGELRHLKGVDLFLDALARLRPAHDAGAFVVGSGPDESAYREQVAQLGLSDRVDFLPAMPARQAFGLARCLVVPSRAESFPYIVLEAAAAGVPGLFADVGGIPEIVAGTHTRPVAPGDAHELAVAMQGVLGEPGRARAEAAELRAAIADKYTLDEMTASVQALYAQALGSRVDSSDRAAPAWS